MDSEVERLHSLADSLVAEFKQGRGTSYVDKAINLDRKALELCPPGHPNRFNSLISLAVDLSNRYSHLGAIRDLEEAISHIREGLALCSTGHHGRPTCLNTLASCLFMRYKRCGVMADLENAIVLSREGLGLRPQGDPLRSYPLHNLSRCLSARFRQLGEMKDLNEAIALDCEALVLHPPGHSLRSYSLNSLATDLSLRYGHLGTIEDLDTAIIRIKEALNILPQGNPLRSSSLNNLALCLSIRYKQLGVVEDPEEAIALNREALGFFAPGHPFRPRSLTNLALCLAARHEQLGEMEDLNEAIILEQEALDLCPEGNCGRSMALNNTSLHLMVRFGRLGLMRDLEVAIALGREAVDLHPLGHPERSLSLNNLVIKLVARYEMLGTIEDLGEAIVIAGEALSSCPPGHPDRSRSLECLTGCLHSRYMKLQWPNDVDKIFSLYSELVHVTHAVSFADLSAARAWVRAAEWFQHPTMVLAYETTLRLLVEHLAILPLLPQNFATLKKLTSSLATDAFSMCLQKHAPARAVELLEQGRGVFWSQLARLRSPLHDVIGSSPQGRALADKFGQLASLIRDTLSSPGVDQHGKLFHLNVEMQRVVSEIRKLPGLSQFLLPLLFSDLQRAASEGPVVIVNASKHGCDALIILCDQDPIHVPLQITQQGVKDLGMELHSLTVRTKRLDVTKELASFLRCLWNQVVSPIMHTLQMTCPSQTRIWWCPTAQFSTLPLHAAGPYRKGRQNMADLCISSYTPTLTALMRARACSPSGSTRKAKRFIAIGQANAAGQTELPSVSMELDVVARRLKDHTMFMCIDGEASCVARAVEELGKHAWVHLACHGLPNSKQPFKSAFALRDGHLTIHRLITCDSIDHEFAYLSACHTIVGDEEGVDEMIHLASAMQFAGFRSVIGTMWAVDDSETAKITSMFYKVMLDGFTHLDHTRAAFALNKTMKTLDIPFDQQILYVHLGA